MATTINAVIMPVFLILMISLVLWVFTFRIGADANAAALGSILFFSQADIKDSFELNLRFVWLLGAFYLVTFGLIAHRLLKRVSYLNTAVLIVIGFLVAGTRLSFLPWLVVIANIGMHSGRRSMVRFLRDQIILFGTLTAGVFIAFLVFARKTNSTLLDYLILSASDWPINI